MEYNVAKERIKFFKEQDRLAEKYRKAGMTEEQIKVLFDYDYEVFKKERLYRVHNQFMDLRAFGEESVPEEKASIADKFFEQISTDMEESKPWERFGWVEKIENLELYEALKNFPLKDIELITMYVFEGYSLAEIAEIRGVSPQAVGKKMRKLKKFLKKI